MPRRLVVRLAVALAGLVVALVGGLVVLVLATSGPVLPPRPLPTATAQPGPQSTSLAVGPPLPTATAQPGPGSTPLAAGPSLPTATAQPSPLDLAGGKDGPGADPNGAVRALMSADGTGTAAATDLIYRDSMHPRAGNPPCGPGGRWSLQVDPENVVGYPYSRPPGAADWDRAAAVVATAAGFCPAPVAILWFGHDAARPSSDRWTAVLPPAAAAGIDGPALRRYALAHARQL